MTVVDTERGIWRAYPAGENMLAFTRMAPGSVATAISPLAVGLAQSLRHYAAAPKMGNTDVTAIGERASTFVKKDGVDILVDEPVRLGGRGEGASPLAHFLGSLVGCSQYTLYMVCNEKKINMKSSTWRADAKFDMNGIMGKADVYSGFQEINVEGTIDLDVPQDQLDQLSHEVEKRCIVSATVQRTGIPYSFALIKRLE